MNKQTHGSAWSIQGMAKKKTVSLESPTKVEGDNFGKLWPDYEVYPMPG